MSYLINSARPASLTIGGVEYIDNLVSFQVQDASAFRNGVITTQGTIVLGSMAGDDLSDYERDSFKRGSEILFEITYPSGDSKLHPRGRLQVVSATYSPEAEQVILEVGCSLVMAKLLNDDDSLLPYEEVPLDASVKTFEGIASSLAAAGKFIYQDNTGTISTLSYLESTAIGYLPTAKFTSVRGVTAIAVAPLAATAAIPDQIKLGYQVPSDTVATDNQGRVDTVVTESKYFIRYPATTFERIRDATVDIIEIVGGGPQFVPGVTIPGTNTSGCGNVPSPPTSTPGFTINVPGQETIVQVPAPCSEAYKTVASPQFVPAKRIETRTTTYDGPAAQTSLQQSEVTGPELELNSQYYADKFAFCGSTYANECLPSPCPMYGTDNTLLGKQSQQYFYGESGEVTKTVTTTWRPKLAAAQPTDWRSGIVKGVAQDFDNDFADTYKDQLYRHQVITRTFKTEENEKIQQTDTYTSAVSRGGGIGGELDAYKGIHTQEVRRSTTSVTSEVKPDSVNAASTAVTAQTTNIILDGKVGGYVGNAGPYILEEDAPVPFLYDDLSEANSAADVYGNYLAKFVQGDARGLNIAEALRQSIGEGWSPNAAFNYHDPISGKLMVMRVDACSWGADESGCVVVLNGIWIDDITGTVTLPENLTGVVIPDMGGGDNGTPTPDPVNPEPVIPDPTITGKRYNFSVDVKLHASALINLSGGDGVRPKPPGDQDVTKFETLVFFIRGQILQPGALVSVNPDGSVSLTSSGDVVVDESLIVVDDDVLFPPAST